MAVNPELQGRVFPPTAPYLVGREKIREFSRAVLSTNPINFDVDAARAGQAGPTIYAALTAILRERMRRASGPVTLLNCDNLRHNGDRSRAGLLQFIEALGDGALADWVQANTTSPNAMVDRITPATTDRERNALSQDYGIEDNWPVYCEEFIQWVLEDNFCNGRPEFEAAGVQFVADVTPFEFMKIRILNGGHAAIAYPASLLDIHFVHDAMNHPLVGAFFAKIEREEIMPTVPPVPGGSCVTSRSATITRPARGCRRPQMISMSVVLPQPVRPMSTA